MDSTEPIPEGFGCRPAALALLLLAAFVTAAATAGISIALSDGCGGACETLGFTLYAAALPVSGVFAAVAGDLPVAWPLDTTLWVVAALAVSRVAELRRVSVLRVVTWAMLLAFVYGFAVSFFIESAV